LNAAGSRTTGTVVQVNTSPGGMPKVAVEGSAHVSKDGVEGDWQKNRKYHGGPDRAVCLFSVELYRELEADGVALRAGDVGENFTTEGIDLQRIGPGSRLRVGEVLIEVTKVRVPCRSLDRWDKRLMGMMKGRSGWMAKVVEEGVVRAGDAVEIVG
jgi:MOSC domain-containing protein YiiM